MNKLPNRRPCINSRTDNFHFSVGFDPDTGNPVEFFITGRGKVGQDLDTELYELSVEASKLVRMICSKCNGTGKNKFSYTQRYNVLNICNYEGYVNGIVNCSDGIQEQPEIDAAPAFCEFLASLLRPVKYLLAMADQIAAS